MPASEVAGSESSCGRLCGELVSAIALRVTRHVSDRPYWLPPDIPSPGAPGMKGALFFHQFDSAYRCAETVLLSFGVAAAVVPGIHALAVDAIDIPDMLAKSVREKDDRLPFLLETFIRVHCGFDELSARRTPFKPPEHLASAMLALMQAGYAARDGDQFCWTSKIATAMRAADYWGVGEQETEMEAQLAWRTMPSKLKTALKSGKVHIYDLSKLLVLKWRDGRWHSVEVSASIPEDESEMPLAERLMQIAREEK